MYNAGHGVLVNAIAYINQIEDAMLQGFTLPESILNMEFRIWEEEKKVLEEKKLAAAKIDAEKKALEAAKTLAGREKAAAKRLAEEKERTKKTDDDNNVAGRGTGTESGTGSGTSGGRAASEVSSAEELTLIAKEVKNAEEGKPHDICTVCCVLWVPPLSTPLSLFSASLTAPHHTTTQITHLGTPPLTATRILTLIAAESR